MDSNKQKHLQTACGSTVLVRYGKFGNIGHFQHQLRRLPSLKAPVVIQTDRGLELGETVSPFASAQAKPSQHICIEGPSQSPPKSPGRLIRLATAQDLNEQRHLEQQQKHSTRFCKTKIRELALPMKLVDIEHILGGERIVFYFKAEGRVDFRQLVRLLQREFQTTIEMRQIGARDEARLLGDCDTCGRELCCKQFLKVLQPVNIRMAKNQRVPLHPHKISGVCGRLKCCLRYENMTYEELAERLPKKNQTVQTPQGPGKVLDTMVLTQLVKLRLLQGGEIIALNVEELLPPGQESLPPQSSPQKSDVREPHQRRSRR